MNQHSDWYPGHLREITPDECGELLKEHHVGRVAWCEQDGPIVLPVNYRVVDDEVLFRISPHSAMARQFTAGPASFQVDEFDDYTQSGWSVLVRGRAELVPGDELPDPDDRPEPWAEGTRNVYIRICANTVTGRRVFPS